jgi:hypothetical protein
MFPGAHVFYLFKLTKDKNWRLKELQLEDAENDNHANSSMYKNIYLWLLTLGLYFDRNVLMETLFSPKSIFHIFSNALIEHIEYQIKVRTTYSKFLKHKNTKWILVEMETYLLKIVYRTF